LVIGKLLNQYRLEQVVGEGGMGVVYRALDINLERTVAVKILSASFREDPEFIERFRQEARIQAGLNHPNIATLFDFFVWNDMPVAVMEFIKGETLRSMVDRNGLIPAHVALPIFIQALRGVAAGHKRGIIHRDLKPSNLLITDEGTVKITDFGIAKVRRNTGFTRESTRVGSVKYMAPEQILARPVDERTDIYIMGGTLYELLTGRPPFRGVSQFEIDSAHVRDRPKLPTEYCPHIPPAAVDAVMRALAKEPSERFATAEEFIQALPDLHGVPYIAAVTIDDDATRRPSSVPKAARAQPPATVSPDETRQQQNTPKAANAERPETVSLDQTLPQQNAPKAANAQRPETGSPDQTLLQQNASKAADAQHPETASPDATLLQQAAHARRAGTAIAIGGLLALSIVGIVLYSARQADVGTDQGRPSQSVLAERAEPTRQTQHTEPPNTGVTESSDTAATAPPDTAANTPPTVDSKPTEPVTPAPSPTLESSHDLTGMWSGTYVDRSGRARLQLLNLQMQQVPDGAITGRFTYTAGSSAGEDCTLDKSSYSRKSKRLRLITHCHNPDHPKYLNVPLEFIDVDPGATTIEGGRLAFHLADDIVVTLERTKGI
jgi:serine/threonine protein kinase